MVRDPIHWSNAQLATPARGVTLLSTIRERILRRSLLSNAQLANTPTLVRCTQPPLKGLGSVVDVAGTGLEPATARFQFSTYVLSVIGHDCVLPN